MSTLPLDIGWNYRTLAASLAYKLGLGIGLNKSLRCEVGGRISRGSSTPLCGTVHHHHNTVDLSSPALASSGDPRARTSQQTILQFDLRRSPQSQSPGNGVDDGNQVGLKQAILWRPVTTIMHNQKLLAGFGTTLRSRKC